MAKNNKNCKDGKCQKGDLGNKMGTIAQTVTEETFIKGKRYSEEDKNYNALNQTKNSK